MSQSAALHDFLHHVDYGREPVDIDLKFHRGKKARVF